ncbi:MAG: efflux RND transporter periplasmic adaptor subunit [Desulfamplus sp.]|nr:efflux RND transporter periplasmic adaptor subunit [Desulfamplus sp.]
MKKQMLAFGGLLSMSPIKRYFVITAVTGLILLVAGGCKKKEEPVAKEVTRPVKVVTVGGRTDAEVISLPAKTRANLRADLSFKVAGPLIELPVEEGQEVEKGQLIARIDPRDFETNLMGIKSSLSEAIANLKSMERGARAEDIKMLESGVDAAKAEYLFAEDQYKRYKQLWINQHASKADFDRQTSLRDKAKAGLESARQDLAKGKKGARKEDIDAQQSRIRGLEASLKAAQDALKDTYLKAPFAGIMAKRYVENHQEIQAKQPIAFLQDISKIEILVDVPETLMTRVREGYVPDLAVKFAGAPDQSFQLTFKEFSTEADPQTLTYQAVFVMPRPQGINILPGMTATVEGKLKSAVENASRIVIPAITVSRDPEKIPYVWVLNESDMTVKKTKVQVGELTGSDDIVILDGLHQGEKVVTAGITRLRDGMKVSIWDALK